MKYDNRYININTIKITIWRRAFSSTEKCSHTFHHFEVHEYHSRYRSRAMWRSFEHHNWVQEPFRSVRPAAHRHLDNSVCLKEFSLPEKSHLQTCRNRHFSASLSPPVPSTAHYYYYYYCSASLQIAEAIWELVCLWAKTLTTPQQTIHSSLNIAQVLPSCRQVRHKRR